MFKKGDSVRCLDNTVPSTSGVKDPNIEVGSVYTVASGEADPTTDDALRLEGSPWVWYARQFESADAAAPRENEYHVPERLRHAIRDTLSGDVPMTAGHVLIPGNRFAVLVEAAARYVELLAVQSETPTGDAIAMWLFDGSFPEDVNAGPYDGK